MTTGRGVLHFRVLVAGGLLFVLVAISRPFAQHGGMFQGSADDPAIKYSTAPLNNAVAAVNDKLRQGTARLSFQGRSGYLRSALAALDIPIDSQMLVFSKTSLQARRISPDNPRALFFTDRVVLGWVRDGEVLEVAAHDASQGIVFYTLDQRPAEQPQFKRVTACLGCHSSGDTLGVPGLFAFSTRSSHEDEYKVGKSVLMDHRMPITERWGGWFVTGTSGAAEHIGNDVPALSGRPRQGLSSVAGLFDADGYVSMSSDIAALLVFSHQTYMTNLLTRAAWEARAADPRLHAPFVAAPGEDAAIAVMMRGVAKEVVDYALFIDEPRLPDHIRGVSGFVERFSASGPRDHKGRSLHDLDLDRRLMKYPCSYLIDSPAFDALPRAAKDPVYHRLWQVLSGEERGQRYLTALSRADRQAIVEILRDTKTDLPAYFQGAIR